MKRVLLVTLCSIVLLSGCAESAKNPAAPAGSEEAKGVEKEWRSGPLVFRVTTDKSEITIADKLTLTLEATIDKKYQVTLPEILDKLAEFGIKDYTRNTPVLADANTMKYSQVYVLEPYLSGEYTIPAFTVRFRTEDESADNPHVLESEPIKIKVTSMLPEDIKELVLKPAIGPVVPPPPDMGWLFILIGCIVVIGGGAGFGIWYYLKKRAEKLVIVTIPAHELAYRQLRKLVAEKLIEREEYRLFYYKISDILRHYIENRFRIRAPEETTEEFLEALKTKQVLGNEQKRLLKLFLEHCDLVKFARHTPLSEEIQKTFDTVKDFIRETESAESRIEDSGTPDAEPSVTTEGL